MIAKIVIGIIVFIVLMGLSSLIHGIVQIISHMKKYNIQLKDLVKYYNFSKEDVIYNGIIIEVAYGVNLPNEKEIPIFRWSKTFIVPASTKFDSEKIKELILKKLKEKVGELLADRYINVFIDNTKLVKNMMVATDEMKDVTEEQIAEFITENISCVINAAKHIKEALDFYNDKLNEYTTGMSRLITDLKEQEVKSMMKFITSQSFQAFENAKDLDTLEKELENYIKEIESNKASMAKINND